MFIRVKKSPHNPNKNNVQIIESVREGNKVRQTIVRHVGVALNDIELKKMCDLAEFIKAQIENEHIPSFFTPEELAKEAIESRKRKDEDKEIKVDLKKLEEEQRINIGLQEIYGTIYDDLFGQILPHKRGDSLDEILKNIVIARIANPQSKRASARFLEEDFGIKISLDKIYRMMDNIDDNISMSIQKKAYQTVLNLFDDKIDVIFLM